MSFPATIGDNRPPSQIEFTGETSAILNEFLKEHPVILSEEAARAGKLLADRAYLCLQDLDDERRQKVGPLNEQVAIINETYRKPRTLLERIKDELFRRIGAYAQKEEEKRQAAAEQARLAAEEAERKAREAEAAEQEAHQNPREGVETDILLSTTLADEAFAEYEKAAYAAALAEREAKVKIGGGFRRSMSLRNREIPSIIDAHKAIAEMGLTPKIEEAIISSAKSYHRITGEWPEGISVTNERKI